MLKARILVGAAALAATVAYPTATQAAPHVADGSETAEQTIQVDIERFQNQYTEGCLTMFYSWTYADSISCRSMDPQRWRVTVWGDGTRELQSVETGKCLADNGSARIVQRTCNQSQTQSWYVTRYSDGDVRFKNQYYGWCMADAKEGDAFMEPCENRPRQRWS